MGLATGFQFFYEEVLGLNPSAVICAFDFHTQSGDQIVNQPWITGINGTVNNSGNFYFSSGSGAFNGETYIYLNSGLNLPEWTAFFTYQKQVSGRDNILLSTISGDNFSNGSGFQIAINPANKLYIAFANNVVGPQVFTFSEIISDKNMLSVSKSDSTIFFNYFDVNSKQGITESYSIEQNVFINSTNWSIGGRTQNNYWSPGDNLSGFIDNFVLVSGFLDISYQNSLFSGFYSQYNNGTLITGLECVDIAVLTGVQTGISSGIIGQQTSIVSSLTDLCGRTNTVYSWENITGIVSGEVFVIVNIESCSTGVTLSGTGLEIFSDYLYDFGMDQLNLAWTIDENDWSDSYVLTGLFSDTTRNKIARWNALNQQYFLDASYGTGDVGLYLNGVLNQAASGVYSFPSGYGVGFVISGDYFISGVGRVYSTGYYQTTDTILYDVVNNNIQYIAFTGFNSGVFPGVDFSNKLIFLNGQKLRSGISGDYIAPNTLLLDVESGNNILELYNLTGFSNYTGANSGVLNFPDKFLRNTSQLFFNGVRGEIGNYYWESSSLDLLGANYTEPSILNPLYLNSDDFLNY